MTELPNNKTLIVLAGPTAVGKTSYSIQLAQLFKTEIVSADSRQLYKELNIGVARPSFEELNAVPHHFIASHSILEDYNAGKYENEAVETINKLFEKYNVVILTGGTGLYIKAVTEGLDSLPPKNELLRSELQSLIETQGIESLKHRATALGISEEKVAFDNPQRLIRAIEIAEGMKHLKPKPTLARNFTTKYFYLNRDRTELYERINLRVDNMIAEGLEKEARTMYANKELNALQTVGYKEFFAYFDGHISRELCIEKIKQNSRNYAKRQVTWFKNQGDYAELPTEFEKEFWLELLN